MLEPQDRHLFHAALRPPPGYELDIAIGTTYSLDLVTLLTVPLAFTFFDYEDEDGRPTADPLALLAAVRRHARRIHLFCQAGQINVPGQHQVLFSYLEDTVVEVQPPHGGVFHPKVWVLRFVASDQPVRYRLLVQSRNLTFDRSWDVLLTLEGPVLNRRNAIGRNHPLGDFVRALAGMAVRPMPEATGAALEQVQTEIRRVDFAPPEGFDDLAFWPLGVGRQRSWPFAGTTGRLLVISPFVTPGCLARLTERGKGHMLVSRAEELVALDPGTLGRFQRVQVLHDGADPEPEDAETEAAHLSGLHAKLFVADEGWNARVWVGSANATDAAFAANVEFLVELDGRKSRCGIEAILGANRGDHGLAALLVDYNPPDAPAAADPVQAELDQKLQVATRQLATAGLVARVGPVRDDETYPLSLHLAGDLVLLKGVAVRCRPVTLRVETTAQWPVSATAGGEVAAFGAVSLEALTSFFTFVITASVGGQSREAKFVLNLPLQGAPAEREQNILRVLLRNRDQVLRYLLFLLGDSSLESAEVLLAPRTGGSPGPGGGSSQGLPLFETMVRALHRSPARLDQIARVVADLRRTEAGRALLPEGFDAIWEPIWTARQGVRG